MNAVTTSGHSPMTYFLGTDEAGYGPNLGPLVITATLWRAPAAGLEADLYELLGDAVTSSPRGQGGRVAIADSKKLYKSGGGLALLELGVLCALRLARCAPGRWREAFTALDARCRPWLDAIPWYSDFDGAIPREASPERIERFASKLERSAERAGVRLLAVRSAVVFPEEFNELTDRWGGKGTVLSRTTLSLLSRLVAPLDDEPVLVQCDKHGGRNRYGSLLQHAFPDELVQIVREGRDLSVYRWGPVERRVEARFAARGERYFPSALASMVSKYLRELAMQALNDFWRRRLPGLKPTAGYPADARRFHAEIRSAQAELGVSDRMLWRNR